MNSVIKVENVYKSYKNVIAVNNLSLDVRKGEIFGLLGANGAGKTTGLEMMMGLTKPDQGNITVAGVDVIKNPKELKELIGIQLQKTSIYDRIKVKEALALFSSYYKKKRNMKEIIEILGLTPYLNKYVKNLSGGWQQRTSLALALVNDPEVIFLDEPTTGLDPEARIQLWQIINMLKDEGKTIILSTHYMEEVKKYCSRAAILKNGELVICDTPSNLISSLGIKEGSMDDVYAKYASHSMKGA
ncbi:ABC transporter ATP-binding protein [Bacillus sp. T33-2]|uniref:ABC transporter ATP-binding protein n=1 Tax=Bacillus sp. T33-2 TaxID=2054168 RepID=UPI000C78A956|nr:ABC transporter ATP-binding protein [Bacillus sp. T33-2]PLR91093.1 ABC transporter ATP-binding protein [Bacillus sp. T33-2]